MNLLLDQQADGSFIVIDEDGKALSDPIMGRPAAYAEMDRIERKGPTA